MLLLDVLYNLGIENELYDIFRLIYMLLRLQLIFDNL